MLIRFFLLVLLLVPTWAQAVTLFSETFDGYGNEAATVTALQSRYACSYSLNPFGNGSPQDVDSAQAFSGTYSVKQRYTGSQYDTPPQGGGSCEYDFDIVDPGGTSRKDVWITWYHRFGPGFQTAGGGGVGGVATKGLYMYMKSLSTGAVHGWVFHYFYGGQQLTMSAQGIKDHKGPNGPGTGTVIPYDTENMWQNVSAWSQPDGDWVCYEANYKLNDPGVANGQYLLYSTNVSQGGVPVLRASHTNREFLDTTPGGLSPSDSRWYRFKFYRQDGLGDMWYDNVSVTSTRIGCTGGAPPPPPPADTVPPTVPTNVTVSNTVPLQHTIAWTASTDASSPITYAVDYCTGAACTPATTLTSTTGVSAVHTGLTGATVYGYRVRARDPNGNTSAVTSTVYSTANSAAAASAISITSNGLFAINGVTTFLLGASYMDAQNWHESDIDTLAAAGFNNIRTFANYAEDAYAGARSVCTSDGSLNTTRRDVLQALIDYAQTKSMTVTIIIMSDLTQNLIPVDANKQTCVTNIVNAYEAEPLVMFDLNNEHTEAGNTWMNTTTEYATYHALAKAACASCIIFASSTSPFSHPQSNGTTIETTYFDGMLNAGVDVIAFHDYRGSRWDVETGPRTTTLRNYLASKGRADIPVYFSEPCRWDFVADCNLAASAYFQAAAEMKAAGGAGWVWHHGYFDFLTQTLFQQLNPTESTVYQGLASALSSGSGGVPVSLATYDFAGTFASVFTGGYTSHDTPNQTGGKLRANATGTESMAQYTGVQTALTSLFTCTTANAGPPPSASWLTLSGNGLKVISNQCGQNTGSTLNVNDAAVWNTDYGNDQVVQATLAALPANAVPDYAHMAVRVQATGAGYDNMYELEIDRSAGTWRKRLYKISSGAYTQLGSTDTTTVSAGSVFKLTAVGDAITAYQDGVVIASAVDTTFPTGGYLAISSYRQTTASTTRWTNVSGGTYVSGDSFATPNNQGATVEISTANGASPQYGRLMVRLQDSPTYSGYDCRIARNTTPTSAIVRKDANNPTTLTSSSTVTWAATDVVGCYADGPRIYMERNGVEILSATDSTYSYGDTGLYMNTAGSPLADFELDNFTVYEYGEPTPACTPSITAAVADATGADVTWATACPPTHIRVETGLSTQTFTLAEFPGGRYTPIGGWKLDDGFACFKPVDAQGTINQTDYVCDSLAGLIATDTTVPVMTMTQPTGELPNGTTSSTASFTTNEQATCVWDTSNTTYALMANTATTAGLTHSFTATGLTTGTTNFYAQCQDVAQPTPNTTTTPLTLPIIVAASTADTTAPTTVTNPVVTAASPSQLSLTHTLSTDAGGDPTYQAWISTDNVTFTLIHTYTGVPTTIGGLTPSTLYYVKVMAIDPSLNPAAAFSNVASATTPNILDVTAPSDPSGLIVTGTYTQSATIAWTPGTDDRGNVTTNIEICSGSAACTAFGLVGTTNLSTYTITGLSPTTIYRVRIKFSDQAGNVSANYSDRVTFTTATVGTILPRQPVAYSQPRLPRN